MYALACRPTVLLIDPPPLDLMSTSDLSASHKAFKRLSHCIGSALTQAVGLCRATACPSICLMKVSSSMGGMSNRVCMTGLTAASPMPPACRRSPRYGPFTLTLMMARHTLSLCLAALWRVGICAPLHGIAAIQLNRLASELIWWQQVLCVHLQQVASMPKVITEHKSVHFEQQQSCRQPQRQILHGRCSHAGCPAALLMSQ